MLAFDFLKLWREKNVYVFLNRKQDLESQDRSGNEDSGDMSEEEEEEEVGDPSSERSS